MQAPRITRGQWRCATPPAAHPLHCWLTDRTSLTARLRSRCQQFSVRLLRQGFVLPHRDEAALLGLRGTRRVLLREVLLLADGVPVVYARTVLSPAGLRGVWNVVAGIGNRPLGAALFADPLVWRGTLTQRRLDRRDRRYRQACAAAGLSGDGAARTLWARRSVFVRKGQPLVVSEIFLPGIRELPR